VVRSSDVSSSLAKPDGSSSDVSNCLAKPDGSELRCFFEFIRCVELRDWPAFYTSDKLLRLRQQKMYLMKKDFVTL
jgi:hypothetical protein